MRSPPFWHGMNSSTTSSWTTWMMKSNRPTSLVSGGENSSISFYVVIRDYINSIICNFRCIIFAHFYDFTGIWFPSRICSVQLKTSASSLSMGSNIWPQGKWLRKISSSMWNMIPWFGSIWTALSIWPHIWKRNCKSFTPRTPTNSTERGMVLLT